ncbi:MAG TPA: LLM class flavin-dependent oxidoreductase [Ktedonobacteraceae bacterium]|jgi:alkanesulfonate monooxygenase SsuD/methylene tetrahydromethanopterin reductase-like flavin-dependent oxidoreductase (luciferase family)|nr:LLM class flavin-dependent oxidoreductase [Ktedonobacteraceae bacterium]
MTKVQFGWSMASGPRNMAEAQTYMADLQRGLELISGHFDSAWMVDHLQYDDSNLMEGWTAITYMSALAPTLKFGNIVLCQSFRNPALLAKMGATLQFMSGGRFILGIGAGWKEDEYTSYGYPFPSAGTRVEELDETMQILHAMWHDKRATFKGKHYSVVDAWCEPKPEPIPTILIGAFKPRMLRVAARYADWWNVSWTPIERYRTMVEECERACAEVKRDPATLRRTWYGGCICAPTEAEVKRLNTRDVNPERGWFVGTPERVREQMQPFIDLGVDYFIFSAGGFPNLTTLEIVISEVMPKL